MKRNKKTERLKAFLRKEEELSNNWDAQRALGYKPLDNPIHYGYNGEWILREDISRSEEGENIESVIYHFLESVWCKDKTFTEYDLHQNKKIDVRPYFKTIDEDEYENLLPWCKKFFTHYFSDDIIRWGRLEKYYRVNLPEYYFKLKITKNYKTHYKVIDEVLMQEQAEIEFTLDNKFYNERRANWAQGPDKKTKQLYNRAERHYNKQALIGNMRMEFAKYDDINSDWGCWLSEYCDEFYEFKYNHRNVCKWDWW